MGAFRSTPLRTALVLVASVLLLAASLSLLAVTAHAWLSDTVTNENNTITGVLPNQPIDKDPTITNVGNNDAYIRAKINYDGLSAEQAAQVEALLNIDEEAWVKGADGYYYYQEILAAGAEPIQLFTVLTIPNWGNEVKDLSFTVGITAEAVQSDYFTPDGDGVINGWGALNPAA